LSSQRLKLQTSYGQAMIHARGYSAPETTAAFARARELTAGIEDAAERFSIYYGLWVGSRTLACAPGHRWRSNSNVGHDQCRATNRFPQASCAPRARR
jgi:hypothetical protein